MQKRFALGGIGLLFLAAPFFASADSNCPVLSRALARGARGNDVIQLQQFLIAQGALQSGLATGYFGALTEAGVKQWQSQNGVDPIGIVGPKTRAAIANECNNIVSHPYNSFGYSPQSGPAPLKVGFGYAADANSSYSIDFGDGVTQLNVPTTCSYRGSAGGSAGSCIPGVDHTYVAPGNYQAKLMKMGASGQTELLQAVTITVTNGLNVASTTVTVQDVTGYYDGHGGWYTCSKAIKATVTHRNVLYTPNVDDVVPLDAAEAQLFCHLTGTGYPVENEGKITVLQRPEVQALVNQYNYKDVHIKALEFKYIQDKGFVDRLLPAYKGREIGCIIVLETPGGTRVYLEDEKLDTFEELNYATFQQYLDAASPADRQLFLDNLR